MLKMSNICTKCFRENAVFYSNESINNSAIIYEKICEECYRIEVRHIALKNDLCDNCVEEFVDESCNHLYHCYYCHYMVCEHRKDIGRMVATTYFGLDDHPNGMCEKCIVVVSRSDVWLIQLNYVQDLIAERDAEIEALKRENIELKYRPGGKGAKEAQKNFEELIKKNDFK